MHPRQTNVHTECRQCGFGRRRWTPSCPPYPMGYYRRQFWLRMADPHRPLAQNHPGRACPGSASGVPLTADRGAVRFSRHRARRRCQLTMKTDKKIGDMLASIQSQKQVRMEDTRGGTVAPAIADEYSSSSPSCILGWKLRASRRCVMAMHGIATLQHVGLYSTS